jgi:hypothetical protein
MNAMRCVLTLFVVELCVNVYDEKRMNEGSIC